MATERDPVYGEAIRDFLSSIPVGRPGIPEDITRAVNFLLAPESHYICGSVLFVDGGHHAVFRPDSI